MRRLTTHFTLLFTCALLAACNRQTAERHTVNKPSLTTTTATDSKQADETSVAEKNAEVAEGATATKSIQPAGQLVTLKAITPEKVRVGQNYEYEVHVTNNATEAAVHDVKVRHTLPDGFSIESSKPEADSKDQEAMWTFDELGPGETRKISVVGSSDSEGRQHACLSVTYTPSVCITTEFVKPDIEIVKQAPESTNLCEPITITYHVKNNGSGAAKAISVKDELPAGLTTAEGESTVNFTIEELAPGKQTEVSKSFVATKAGDFSSRAVATTQGGEESRSSKTTTKVKAAQLDVTVDGPASEYIGRVLSYKVRVKNSGNAPAQSAAVSLQFPEGVRFVWASDAQFTATKSADQSKATTAEDKPAEPPTARVIAGVLQEAEQAVVWNLGTLAAGETAEASVSFAGQKRGDLAYMAVANFACGQDNQTKSTTSVQTNLFALPALAVSVVDTPDPVRVGEELRYIITVVNEGTGEESDVQVTATLPDTLEHQSHSGTTNGKLEGQALTFETIDTLKAGERVQWTVIARPKAEGDTKLSVQLKSKTQGEFTAEEPTKAFKATDQ